MALGHDISAVPAGAQLVLNVGLVDSHDGAGHDIVFILFFQKGEEYIVHFQAVGLDHRIVVHQEHMADIL